MPIDAITRDAVFEAYGGRCFYSGRQLDRDSFAVDHVIPRAKGGDDCIENYVLCDPLINIHKSDTLIENPSIVLSLVKSVYAPRIRASIESMTYGRQKKNPRPLIDRHIPMVIETKDIETIIGSCDNPREQMVVMLPVRTGIKLHDGLDSTFGDKFPPELHAELAALRAYYEAKGWAVTDATPLFLSQKGGAITRQQASFILQSISKRAGIAGVTWESLRKHYRLIAMPEKARAA